MKTDGIQTEVYAHKRDKNRALKYRLKRRTEEIIHGISAGLSAPPAILLDVGTADGRMLDLLKQNFPDTKCVGLEYTRELLAFGSKRFPMVNFMRGDAVRLPFMNNIIDVVTVAAVIEHLAEPEQMILECRRVLKPGGIIALTTPDPFWERIATMTGHLKDDKHMRMFKLRELSELLRQNRFKIIKEEKFTLSPVGMPFEKTVEKAVRRLRFDFLMANQAVVGRKA